MGVSGGTFAGGGIGGRSGVGTIFSAGVPSGERLNGCTRSGNGVGFKVGFGVGSATLSGFKGICRSLSLDAVSGACALGLSSSLLSLVEERDGFVSKMICDGRAGTNFGSSSYGVNMRLPLACGAADCAWAFSMNKKELRGKKTFAAASVIANAELASKENWRRLIFSFN